jgi:hypothetical protein
VDNPQLVREPFASHLLIDLTKIGRVMNTDTKVINERVAPAVFTKLVLPFISVRHYMGDCS